MNLKIISDTFPYFKSLYQWLFPQSCFLCGEITSQVICSHCLEILPYRTSQCSCCAVPLTQNGICGQCLKQPPPYQRTQTVFLYDYPVDKIILSMKFNNNLALLKMLGHLMVQHLELDPRPDVLIPVPIHPKRLRDRGYNQSLELAKVIAQQTGIPLNYDACQRIKNTEHQIKLKANKRRENVRGVFRVEFVKPEWQHIVIVDDVMTTGSTVQELANMFKYAGIPRIDIWCCARSSFMSRLSSK